MQDVQDEPLFTERVAGLDIAKAEVEATIRVPGDTTPGRRQQETRTFATTRRELESLADWLRCWGVTTAGMEATGVIRGRDRASATEADGTVCLFPACRRRVIWGVSVTVDHVRRARRWLPARRGQTCAGLHSIVMPQALRACSSPLLSRTRPRRSDLRRHRCRS